MGHALNNTIQDVLIRFKRMDGFDALWVPGTDHAGISTQTVVRKHLDAQGIDYRCLGREKFIEKVWEWREKYGGVILNQLEKMGCSCDWRRTRFTMDEGLSRAVRTVFKALFDRGLLYRGKRIVNWCPVDRTALSDDEVDARDGGEPGHLWHIRYPLVEPSGELTHLPSPPHGPRRCSGTSPSPSIPKTNAIAPLSGRAFAFLCKDASSPSSPTSTWTGSSARDASKITPAHDPNDFEVGARHGLTPIDVMNDDATLNDVVREGIPRARSLRRA